MKLCLAASGGGHIRQLLDLQPLWESEDYFFVTEDTALGRSLARDHPVRFVSHYALGQARLGRTAAMLKGAAANLVQSLRIVRQERPDVVITTGAGAVYWTAMSARALGAKVVLIDSFARFDAPSKFARGLKPFATETIVQSAALKQHWPEAKLFDPLKIIDGTPPPKKPLFFATVGATLGFPRLVDTVLELKASGRLPERVILQIGDVGPPRDVPEGVEVRQAIPFDEVQAILRDAAFVVCHGGTGSLITALRAGCRTVAMPRRFSLGEHYDDHQEEITAAFAARGLVEVALETDDLGACIERARARAPVMATTDPQALIDYLRTRLSDWSR
ncbi:glycosyl transferase family 28 [Sphingomonas sp. MAH-20]|uniref:Glycosyl transferase family 28 n=1 Tax=Sphingomonas horti TaxID=2682842 RepID=A0A6I4J074_9SPHN|nr:glycosyl transferase family 28 [Sphingomonas sp. CGMCC 1.13658]MVO77674.1 glycosyl transferase family 28 [Sphingomonas horti]